MRRVITFNGWLRIGVVMMQMCYNAVFRYIFLSMTFLTYWQIFPDYAAPPCTCVLYAFPFNCLPFMDSQTIATFGSKIACSDVH